MTTAFTRTHLNTHSTPKANDLSQRPATRSAALHACPHFHIVRLWRSVPIFVQVPAVSESTLHKVTGHAGRGFAAGCEARLCVAVSFRKKFGRCAPGSAFGLEYQGLSPNRGAARIERQAWTQSVQGAVATCQ